MKINDKPIIIFIACYCELPSAINLLSKLKRYRFYVFLLKSEVFFKYFGVANTRQKFCRFCGKQYFFLQFYRPFDILTNYYLLLLLFSTVILKLKYFVTKI